MLIYQIAQNVIQNILMKMEVYWFAQNVLMNGL